MKRALVVLGLLVVPIWARAQPEVIGVGTQGPPGSLGSFASVRSYGAKGDGLTDDTSAFVAAYTALAGAACGGNGGVLLIPAGTYVVSSALSWMCASTGIVRVEGETSGGTNGATKASSILKYTGTGTFLTTRHSQVQHLQIEGPGAGTSTTGIKFDRCNKDCWIDDVVVTGFGTGLDISSETSQFTTTISRCRLYANGIGAFVSANRTTISGCEINGNTGAGIRADNAVQLSIADDSIESNGGPGVEFVSHASRAVVIKGNYFESNTGSQLSFATGGGAVGVTIEGNYLNGASTTTTGIDCAVCGDAWIAGNNSTAHAYGLNIGAGSYRVSVVDNSPGSNTNDYNSTSGMLWRVSQKGVDLPITTFSGLAAYAGRIVYCSDCTEADPCAGSGAGALAMRINNRWDCN